MSKSEIEIKYSSDTGQMGSMEDHTLMFNYSHTSDTVLISGFYEKDKVKTIYDWDLCWNRDTLNALYKAMKIFYKDDTKCV